MRGFYTKTLGKQLPTSLRAVVSPLLFAEKNRKIRLAVLRCLSSYPEYTYRLGEAKKLATRDAKLKGYGKDFSALFIENRINSERISILKDMQSEFIRATALLRDLNPDVYYNLLELQKHVNAPKPILYL